MLLIFAQKSWAGLFIHNLVHTSTAKGNSSAKQDAQKTGFNYSCACVDDFLMPVDNTVAVIVFQPLPVPVLAPVFIEQTLPYFTLLLSSLRGPPVVKLS